MKTVRDQGQITSVEGGCGPDGFDDRPAALRLWDRRAAFKPFAVAGVAAVLIGGVLASAIAAPAPTRHGVWAVAFLVLVLGAGQLALGAGEVLLAARAPRTGLPAAVAFNVAGIAILLGVVTDHVLVFDAGSLLLLVTLALLLYDVRDSTRRGWWLRLYRLLIVVLIVSIPIGMGLTTVGKV
ncbi:hypothetical protein KIH27_10655 [Mycobacterium sp. M1]|uniref:Uncharacterized protein n=1 Tax=Mycolicibacter acidiphilus TaxID=2835306 RepID=A0ABS5RIM0_9MYCO|nr:hypothetical protein [Mycolicibacter acidiphilus]MBS9534044.1 hypothetical protein [Mycolicibacter acidiphilus]